MGVNSIFSIPTTGFKTWYLLLDYRILALLIICICILIKFKKPNLNKITKLIIIQDIIMIVRMTVIEMERGWFNYIGSSILDDRLYYNLGSAIFGCAFLIIGVFILSLLYLIIEKIVNYKKSEK